jgi:hypothetical protein
MLSRFTSSIKSFKFSTIVAEILKVISKKVLVPDKKNNFIFETVPSPGVRQNFLDRKLFINQNFRAIKIR